MGMLRTRRVAAWLRLGAWRRFCGRRWRWGRARLQAISLAKRVQGDRPHSRLVDRRSPIASQAPRAESGVGVRVHDSTSLFRKVMSNARDSWSLVKGPNPFLDSLVGDRHALVLPQMFYPRLDQKFLPIFPSGTRIAE